MESDPMQSVARLLKKTKFRKKLIGGVDESDVWAKLDQLQKEFQRVYEKREAELLAVIEYQRETMSPAAARAAPTAPPEPMPPPVAAKGVQRFQVQQVEDDDGE